MAVLLAGSEPFDGSEGQRRRPSRSAADRPAQSKLSAAAALRASRPNEDAVLLESDRPLATLYATSAATEPSSSSVSSTAGNDASTARAGRDANSHAIESDEPEASTAADTAA